MIVSLGYQLLLGTASVSLAADVDPYQPPAPMALAGKDVFDRVVSAVDSTSMKEMPAVMQSNPLQFATLTDFWCAWELSDRKRKPALLIDDMQVEYAPYVAGIIPQTKLLIEAFRKAGLPIFWSTWWRWGPDDGHFNTMDRFYGPIGINSAGNALYNHNRTHGGDVLTEVGPVTDEEKRRVMHKSYSLDMFDERPMEWLVPSGQGTLHSELQALGVDTVVQLGAWTDDCIIATAFHAFALQYDVVLVEDGVSSASKQHFNAIEVMRGAAAKVMVASDVADYISKGMPVLPPQVLRAKSVGARASKSNSVIALAEAPAAPAGALGQASEGVNAIVAVAQVFNAAFLVLFGFVAGWLVRGRKAAEHASPPGLLG